MSSKMQFQVFYGEYNVMYGPNGVDLSAFKRTSSGIDKPLERSFGSICKWLQRGFHVDPLTHVITVQSLVNWEVDSELWELMMIHSTDDWQKYMQAALERGWPLAILVQFREKTQNEIQYCADQGTPRRMTCRLVLPWLTTWKKQVRSTRTREQQVLRRPGFYSLHNSHVPLTVETINLNCLCSLPCWMRMPTSTV